MFLIFFLSQNDSGNLWLRFGCCCFCWCVCLCLCAFVSFSAQSNSPGSDGVPLCIFLASSFSVTVFAEHCQCLVPDAVFLQSYNSLWTTSSSCPRLTLVLHNQCCSFSFLVRASGWGEGRRFYRSFLRLVLKPVLNWAKVCSPNILRTVRRTMIRFLIELLVRRIWLGQSKLYFVINWLVMRCKLRPELAADAQQRAWSKM